MRRYLALSLAGVALVGTASIGHADTTGVLNETYTATAPTPDPTQAANGTCNVTLPTAKHSHKFSVPSKGTLTVQLKNLADWALAVRDDKGNVLADADGGSPTDQENVTIKLKKKSTVTVEACNWAGEPSIPVTITFKKG